MTPLVWSCLLSLSGAAVCFAAGAALVAHRFGRVAVVEREVYERELTRHTAERQSLFRELEIERSARVSPVPAPVADEIVSDAELRREVALMRERLTTRDSQLEALQKIVDRETQLGRANSAVIADELGLLVAASGATHEYNDALASLAAYLTDLGTKARDILPLRSLRQVVVRDVHDVTLTMRPLATDSLGLALVTLAVDPTSTANDNRHN